VVASAEGPAARRLYNRAVNETAMTPQVPSHPTPARAPLHSTLPSSTPSLDELFRFMSEAELRFGSLRLRIEDRRVTTHGEEVETHEVWLRHPRNAKVISRRGGQMDRDFDVWLSDGEQVRAYDRGSNTATVRRRPVHPVGATSPDLPSFARVYEPLTPLPAESLADTFVHPHGYCRNVLATGVLSTRGTAALANGREVLLVRCAHPRTTQVLTDRPDHWLEVAVDTQTGLILLLAEHVGEQTTRRAEVTAIGIDEPIPDSAFTLHLSSDVRVLY
jgi:hypothetical protein